MRKSKNEKIVPAPAEEASWTFFTNHGHVLLCLAQRPGMLLREVAQTVGITERMVQKIIADLESGGVLTRVASSHIRVGTFQYFAAREDVEAVQLLADHAIARHYPEAARASNRYLAFLGGVAERQATLIARWLSIGFIQGVMNTDNC